MAQQNLKLKPIKITILLLYLFIVSCNSEAKYMGDGQFIDNGISAANERYMLNLGEINLNKKGDYTFKLSGLPKKEFVIGFDLIFDKPISPTSKLNNAEVSIKLIDQNESVVIEDRSQLNDWVWSSAADKKNHAFVYNRSKNYFTPQRKSSYTLSISIIKPNQLKHAVKSELLAKSGGWK